MEMTEETANKRLPSTLSHTRIRVGQTKCASTKPFFLAFQIPLHLEKIKRFSILFFVGGG